MKNKKHVLHTTNGIFFGFKKKMCEIAQRWQVGKLPTVRSLRRLLERLGLRAHARAHPGAPSVRLRDRRDPSRARERRSLLVPPGPGRRHLHRRAPGGPARGRTRCRFLHAMSSAARRFWLEVCLVDLQCGPDRASRGSDSSRATPVRRPATTSWARTSDSPLINVKGELVGLMFDGNIHSISGS